MAKKVSSLKWFAAAFAVMQFVAVAPSSFAALANSWHIPFNAEVPAGNAVVGNGLTAPFRMRSPYVEIGPATQITFFQGYYKGDGANQTGGNLWYRADGGAWVSTPLNFQADVNPGTGSHNQFWFAQVNSNAFSATAVIQYYFEVFSSNRDTTFLYGSDVDSGSQLKTGDLNVARANPYSIRNRPGWIFHANNRVNSGSDVQFWAKVGYITNANDLNTRWATNGALYYTTDGSAPSGTFGTPSGTTQVVTFNYDHPENNGQNGGNQSIAGTAMWWVANVPNLLGTPLGTTIKYRIGFWNPGSPEEKFADHNAGTNNTTFSFTNGVVGDPVLTINGLNGNYTTSHVFINEVNSESVPFTIVFSPGQANVTDAEVLTNLNRRDRAAADGNGDGIDDGIVPVDGNTIAAGDDSHYFKAYVMNNAGPGNYTLNLNGNKTGAYRLTARWKVSGDPAWRYYTNLGAGRRDHAIVISPVDARKINLYEANVFNLDSSGTQFGQRGTLEDMFDAPNAPHQGAANHWNLTYLQSLGCNWVWFQPIHPITQEAQQGRDPGSPYSVRNFFDINPYMTTSYNSGAGPNDAGNRAAARAAFAGFVSAANNNGIGVMLDAPFNHTAPDCEISTVGTSLFGSNPSPSAFFRDVEARFYSRDGNYAMRASGSGNIAIAPDRGDFGKWGDVRDVFFGRYAALVDVNPGNNGNYLNEQDWFDYSIGGENSSGDGNGHFDGVTRNVWKYFSEYTLFWLTQTGVPAGSDLATQTSHGIGGLRADFGQGLPPQIWEYIINKTRTRKWNFVFMAESLDGGAVTYRSNRHFDILNENIVFPLKSAGNAADYRNIFESRRNAYGQGLVLLNNMSHDEEAPSDPWAGVVRYAVCSAVDGVPLIFPGQELGISTSFGYSSYETNFGKNIANFKDWNSMLPAWNDSDFGNDQLYPVYSGIGLARLASPALRSSNRFFLNEDGNSQTIFAAAKYETKNASPASSDVVFAFANTDRNASPSGNFHVNQDTDSNSVNDYGIKPGRTYNVKNMAAYIGQDINRRNNFLWGANGRSGSDVLTNGIFIGMNAVPTTQGGWSTNPYEAQYLKLYDVTAPTAAPSNPNPGNAYGYAIGTQVIVTWNPVFDSEGIQLRYKVNFTFNNQGPPQFFLTSSTSATFNLGSPGSTVQVWVQAYNPNDPNMTGPASSTVSVTLLSAAGDEDKDGETNQEEDTAGTNPFDANSVFRVTTVTSTSVTWSTVPGRKYQLETATSPGGTYTNVGSQVTATGNSHTQSVTVTPPQFFRVRIVP